VTSLAVVGAGAGGLSAALLAQSAGVSTTLFDAHQLPGGCASWFRRGPFSFDVGATTLSGIGPGRPLTLWSELTGAPLDLVAADPGLVFHLPGNVFYRWRDSERWQAELARAFPTLDHRQFWRDIEDLAERAWRFLPHVDGFPPTGLRDLAQLPSWLKGAGLLPSLFHDLETFRRMRQGDAADLRRWLNALCMISAQNVAPQVPALIGALALTYPSETYVPRGGMEGLFDGWLKHYRALGGEWRPGERIEDPRTLSQNYSHVVMNTTTWSLEKLLELQPTSQTAWGAFTLYAGVRLERPQPHAYHLVMPAPESGVDDYFVSFSLPEDLARAPSGWQTVTISQHTREESWYGLPAEEYRARKAARLQQVWAHFLAEFPGVLEHKFLQAGTPKTFERYTQRPFGRVGGYPHAWKFPLWRWPSSRRAEGLTQLGDTVFPGQGIVAVVNGALSWWRGSGLHPDLKRHT
jgi:phytoene dehydrogenase-like protein